MRALVLVFVLLLLGCSRPPAPDVPPGPAVPKDDATNETPIGKMCARLRELRCREGFPTSRNGKSRTCYQAMTVAEDTAGIPVACVAVAASRDAVRACGDPSMEITFRCLVLD